MRDEYELAYEVIVDDVCKLMKVDVDKKKDHVPTKERKLLVHAAEKAWERCVGGAAGAFDGGLGGAVLRTVFGLL